MTDSYLTIITNTRENLMMKSPEIKRNIPLPCCICNEPIPVEPKTGWADGNNAQPVFDDRCCDDCNDEIVLPARGISKETIEFCRAFKQGSLKEGIDYNVVSI